jgi:hypothetical protein
MPVEQTGAIDRGTLLLPTYYHFSVRIFESDDNQNNLPLEDLLKFTAQAVNNNTITDTQSRTGCSYRHINQHST